MPRFENDLLQFIENVPPNVKNELLDRYDELTNLQKEQTQMGTATPQLFGSIGKFISNPSSVSVETYKRMLDTDETIGSGIDFMNLAMISRFGDYKHPNSNIQKFVRKALSEMEGSWHENLDEMLSAEWAGFSVTEQVWDFKHDFDGAPAFVPKKLVTYQPLTLVFAVDSKGEVLPDGIYQYQRYHNSFYNAQLFGVSGNSLDGFRPDLFASVGDFPYPIRLGADLSYLTVRIPKEKCIHLRGSSTGKFGNPYGRSLLRRAYKNWVLKDAFLKMWLIAADRKGTPLLVGWAAPNDTVLQQNQGTPGMNEQIKQMRADQAMAATMRNLHNSSFVVFPGKKDEEFSIEAIQVQGDMNVFKDGIADFNKALMRALLIPPLAMTGGDGGGSYALADVQQKMFNKLIDGKLKVYKQGILDQFIQPLLAYNFPRPMWEKQGVGEFVLEESDPEMMEKLSSIFANLTTAGYMSPEDQQDMDEVRQKMNLKKKEAKALYDEEELGSDPGANGGGEAGVGGPSMIPGAHKEESAQEIMDRMEEEQEQSEEL